MGKIINLESRREKMDSIFEVAKYFLSLESMTHLKLQKLCYYAQAWHMALFSRPLVDSKFQAWLHGPVSPELYQRYKQWGWYDISQYEGVVRLESNTEEFLEMIYNVYGSLNGEQLETQTHREQPWIEARNGATGYCTNVINDAEMGSFYRGILDEQ